MSRSLVRAQVGEPTLVSIMIEFIKTTVKLMFTDTTVILTGGVITFIISMIILNTWCLYEKPKYFVHFFKEWYVLPFLATILVSFCIAGLWPPIAILTVVSIICIPFVYVLKHLCEYLLKRFVRE